ncbi:hypothetical protein HYW39_01440 [Candidatus Curtissbacteria bacterium]|nr:hypothetical protein [Candidatus Curtissbacteria bacterium]
MSKLLPFSFLIAVGSLFGLAWIVTSVDPYGAAWYIFALFLICIFFLLFCAIGLLLYFVRTRFYKRYSANWYVYTSFKMAFFVALFADLVVTLSLLKLITLFNVVLAILAVSLLAVWSYLGKRVKETK